MLYLIDAKDQLANMQLNNLDDPHAHLAELKMHFETMIKHHDNLIQMGSCISPTQFMTLIMSSLPASYCSAIQTITAAERIGTTQGTSKKPKMSPDDLIVFFTEEAHHQVIDDQHAKAVESVLLIHAKKGEENSSC